MNLLPAPLRQRILRVFPEAASDQLWLVGGAVRDLLAGRPGKDLDLITTLDGVALKRLGFRAVAPKSSVPLWLRSDPAGGVIEVTCVAAGQLEEDLWRRDFTVNAMALDLDGVLLDPCGGRGDLQARRLRLCRADAFAADPLRTVRAWRFAAEGFEPDAECRTLLANPAWLAALAALPVERCSRELLKALAAPYPERFCAGLVASGLADGWLPELQRMQDVPAGPLEKHPEGDLFTHSLQVLSRVATRSADPLARFCALFHDLGKLATAKELLPRHRGHEEAGAELAKAFCTRLALPLVYRNALAGACRLHGKAFRWAELRPGSRVELAQQARRAGIASILPLLAWGDHPPAGELPGWELALAASELTAAELGVSMERLEELPPAQRSAHLDQLRASWLAVRLPRA
jgi:tRNA nucleotidyltransferase (CCA-adding enzyme)